jgi:hypothetical protein
VADYRRIAVAGLFSAGLLISIGDVFDADRVSDPTVVFRGAPGARDLYVVKAIPAPSPPAAPAPQPTPVPVAVGDTVRLDDHRPEARLSIAGGNGLPPGERIAMTNLTTHEKFALEMRRDPTLQTPVHSTFIVLTVVLEIIAVVILIAGGATAGAQALAVAIFALMYASFNASGSYLGEWYRVAFQVVIEEGAFLGGCLALIAFAMALAPWEDSALAARFWRVARATAVVLLLASVAGYVGVMAFGRGDWMELVNFTKGTPGSLAMLALAGFAFIWSADTARDSEHQQQRRQIAVAGIVALFLSLQYLYASNDESGTGVFHDAFLLVVLACNIAGAVGVAYVMLVEGLFTRTHVISRTVTFSLLSALVAAFFFAVEGVVHTLLASHAEGEGIAVGIAAAIVVGISIRPLHVRIHTAVDELFFGPRRRDANALASFARHAYVFASEDEVLRRTAEELARHLRTRSYRIYLADPQGVFRVQRGGTASDGGFTDRALIANLQSKHGPVTHTDFPALDAGNVVLPLFRRDRLVGVIVCALPPDAEPYAVEEIQALWELAQALAASLAAIAADRAEGYK